jgi:hypothetical protein
MARESRQARRARERRAQEQARRGTRHATSSRSNLWSMVVGAAIVLMAVGIVAAFVFGSKQSSQSANATATVVAGYTPVPRLAVGPVQCSYNEMVSQGFYHVHAHLTLINDGKNVKIPAQIGFEYNHDCLYWVHTHSPSYGIIHIESPYKIVPTLGEFFNVWGVPLSRDQAWKYKGPLTIYVDGKPYTGDPNKIKLYQHTEVTLEVGHPVSPPKKFNFGKYGV